MIKIFTNKCLHNNRLNFCRCLKIFKTIHFALPSTEDTTRARPGKKGILYFSSDKLM